MEDHDNPEFDLMRLAPELQVKVFEVLPTPLAAMGLAQTCRALNALFVTYKKQILAAIRDNMIAPFYEYYAFLGSLHIPESGIKHPPPGGWPNITAENCAGFNKTDFLVDVLRHLPYIVEDDRSAGGMGMNVHNIDYKCNVVDYSACPREVFGAGGAPDLRNIKSPIPGRPHVTRHNVVVAVRDRAEEWEPGGVTLVLDTKTGLIYEEILFFPGSVTMPVQKYFALKMRECRELRQVFVPGEDAWSARKYWEENPWDPAAAVEDVEEPSVSEGEKFRVDMEGKDLNWVRHLYQKFGWPGKDWRKEEGLKAITEYRDRRNAAYEEWRSGRQRRGAEVLQQLGPTIGVLHSF